MIKLGSHATIDIDKKIATVFGKTIELKEADVNPEQYTVPFIGTEEPDSWICIEKNNVIVKVKDKFFAGTLS